MIRAARSLYTNRSRLALIERRIDRASQELTTYLSLAGLSSARIGAFEVERDDEQLRLTHHPLPGARQLSLLDSFADETVDDEDTWATPATAAVAAWMIGQPEVMYASAAIVEGAGDVVEGGARLHDWVFEQAWQRLIPTIQQTTFLHGYKARLQKDGLARALGTVDWVSVADYVVSADDWEPLTCAQAEIVRALLPKRHFIQAEGQPSLDHEALLARAKAGELPCPHCTEPLEAEEFDLLGTPVVRLYCLGSNCTFEEI